MGQCSQTLSVGAGGSSGESSGGSSASSTGGGDRRRRSGLTAVMQRPGMISQLIRYIFFTPLLHYCLLCSLCKSGKAIFRFG